MPAFAILFALVLIFTESSTDDFRKVFEEIADIDSLYTSIKDNLSLDCKTELDLYKKGRQDAELWALQMLDAGAKIPTGILLKTDGDLGNFDQCLNVKGNTKEGIINGKYCLGNFIIPVEISNLNQNPLFYKSAFKIPRYYPIKLATCLPSACSANDIQKVYSALPFNVTFSEGNCQTELTTPELDGVAIFTIIFLGIILVIMGASTAYDVYNYYTKRKSCHPLLTAFSIFTNGKKILTTNNSYNQISCLHGIRIISTMWVILVHRYKVTSETMIINRWDIIKWKEDFANTYILGAAVSVDSFLLMSGLVISYSFMNSKEKGVKFNVFMHYLHRYLRLTPAYAVLILINVSLMKHLGSGPQWPNLVDKNLEQPCRKYWWSALLYVQNYVNPSQPCMGQTWYLAVDTQLFLLSPILLIAFYKWPKIRPYILVILSICSALAAFSMSYIEEVSVNVGFTNITKNQVYIDKIYYPTHTRAAPWLIGLATGYIIYETKRSKNVFGLQNRLIRLCWWLGTLLVLCTCVFGAYDLFNGNPRIATQAAFTGFVTPAWAIAISCLIFACVHGYGGPINWILSNPLMQVTSKLTYSMYILHKLVISLYIYSVRRSSVFDSFEITHAFWGDFVVTALLSVFWVLAFESPIVALEKVIFARNSDKKTNNGINKDKEVLPM